MAIDTGILVNLGFYVSISIIFAILALGFNLQWGYTGLFNAGIAGFFLIRAYIAAFAITPPTPPSIGYPGHLGGFSLPLPVGAVLAMVASGAIAALVALPTVRLRADYLAIATLAFAEVLRIFAINLESITAGPIGIPGLPPPIEFNPPDAFLNAAVKVAVSAAVVLVLLLLLYFMAEAPWGRVLRAVCAGGGATLGLG